MLVTVRIGGSLNIKATISKSVKTRFPIRKQEFMHFFFSCKHSSYHVTQKIYHHFACIYRALYLILKSFSL